MRRPKAAGGRRRSIRARMLAIVLIPSIALLIIGVGGAGYLVYDGHKSQDWAETVGQSSAVDLGNAFIVQLSDERRLSLMRLADPSVAGELKAQRDKVNGTLVQLRTLGKQLVASNPDALGDADALLVQLLGVMQKLRQGIDVGKAPVPDVYSFYSKLIDIISLSQQGIAKSSPDPKSAAEGGLASDLLNVADAMSRSYALAAGGTAKGGMDNWSYQEFSTQVGHYHAALVSIAPRMTQPEQAAFAKLQKSPEWRTVTSAENALVLGGPGTGPNKLPVSPADWQKAAIAVHDQLLGLYATHHTYAAQIAADTGRKTFVNSLIGGGVIVLITLIAMFVAIRLSNRLVNRLKSLRKDTLDLADSHLPDIVSRLRQGEQIEVDREVPPLQYGRDEIGEVAEAFNKAQRTAVAAAAQEAEIQNGVRAVFLNIAHRSQVVVHRQLDVLDKAEREQENPEHLEQLFQLDHLATRARRNAENLLILGGDQPGRQWRNPVPLGEIVRSAVGETEHYKRVTTGRLPEVRMAGTVVADLIHLLAELVDNATSFSPPDSRVEVSGNIVGKGVVIEVEDQGIGLGPDQLERINAFLRNPPDFGVMALSEDARLGLFVVSQLAIRHGVSVTLIESLYGGVRAIVLVPSASIADDHDMVDIPAPKQVGPAVPDRTRRLTGSANGASMQDQMVQDDPEMTGRLEGAIMTNGEAPQAGHDGRVRRAPTAPPTNGDGHVRPGAHPSDGRPALPRRRRQSNLAPQLTDDLTEPAAQEMNMDDTDVVRSAERARNRMLAFQRGTRNGRAGHDPNNW